jgi:predicted secreted hydrolase
VWSACSRYALVYLGLSVVPVIAGCCPSYFYELVTANPVVRLPLDEAPHCSGNEWWYYTGRITTDQGRSYGIEAVIFQTADLPPLNSGRAWVAHYAVLDETTGAFTYDQGVWVAESIASSAYPGFRLNTPLMQMRGAVGRDRIQAAMFDGRLALDLNLVDQRGAILHGGTGYVDYGPQGHSFYYTRPEMQASGTLLIDGRLQNVTGTLWFDRQWGHDLNNPWLQWDWFSLRLNDGTCVMMFMFRSLIAPVAMGTYIPPKGAAFTLAGEDFIITPTATWTSPHTGGEYPTSWRIQIPSQDLDLMVTAVAQDQEVDARWTTFNIYWEGLCTVSGTRGDQPIAGDAYVEMTNRASLQDIVRLP